MHLQLQSQSKSDLFVSLHHVTESLPAFAVLDSESLQRLGGIVKETEKHWLALVLQGELVELSLALWSE